MHVVTDEKATRDVEDLHTSYSPGVSTVIEHALRSGGLTLVMISIVEQLYVSFQCTASM